MSVNTVIRTLAPSEESFTFSTGLYVGYGVEVVGELDLAALRRALDVASERYPVLRARLDGDGNGHALIEGDAPTMAVHEAREGEDVLDGLVIAQADAVISVYVQRYPNERHVVSVVAHHGIADAHHALALLGQLWSDYTDLVDGTPLPPHPTQHYPEPVEQFLTVRGISPGENDATNSSRVGSPAGGSAPDAPAPPATIPMRRVQLTRAQTAALMARGRRHGLTVNEQISAAFVEAAARANGVSVSQIGYVYMVDLRHRVPPHAGYTDITNALGFARFQSVDQSPAAGDLAAQIGASLRADLAAGTLQRSPFRAQSVFDDLGPVPTLLTNWGRIPALRTPNTLTVTGFHPRFHVEFSAEGMQSPPNASFAMFELLRTMQAGVIFWFDDRLSIDLIAAGPMIEPLAVRLAAVLDETLS
ncbi:hypothetical protein AB0L82_34025 [Nocardia sp. NPDC052001]|uniref:phthiocerol/phthiodiolone dimycocerosyl transferase family protein n=1 Tax=Nocardia sp. NPDC052001 TaxID=3154853 RepID=UPI003419A3E7